jgi:hypothetical protein
MAIIEIVQGDGAQGPRLRSVRTGWFVLIWAASTAVFFVVAHLLYVLVPK